MMTAVLLVLFAVVVVGLPEAFCRLMGESFYEAIAEALRESDEV